jgi:hypothetical protein
MSGLSVRAAAQGDRSGRALTRLAAKVDDAGLAAQANLLRTAGAELGALAQRCARDPGAVGPSEIARVVQAAVTSCDACIAVLDESGLNELVEAAVPTRGTLERLAADARAEMQ